MATEYKTEDDKIKLLKMLIGAVCNNLSANDEQLEETGSSGGPRYKRFKEIMLRANFTGVVHSGKRNLAREALTYWDSTGIQMLIDYVELLENTLDLFDNESKKNDVWIIPYSQATHLVTKQKSNFAGVNTPVNVRNSDKIHLLLNRIHELVE
jgi:hypothetical protein